MSSKHLQIIDFPEHSICQDAISQPAREIIHNLYEHGYEAYIVGGAIRDLLVGLRPKDFDIVTNATPEQIKSVFKRRCRIIGKRFRLAHIYSGKEIFEVATYRGDSQLSIKNKHSQQILCDNVFGTIEEDAFRRDFSCNALYYDIRKEKILDYCGGYDDIRKGHIQFIGDPTQRIAEDPVRIIRAIKFHVKLGLEWDAETEQAFIKNSKSIRMVSKPRLFDELVKLFHCGSAENGFKVFLRLGLFQWIFPDSASAIKESDHHIQLISNALKSTDTRLNAGKSITPIFLFACFYWPAYQKFLYKISSHNRNKFEAINKASNLVFQNAHEYISIPRIVQLGIKNIWMLQHRFEFTRGKKVYVTLDNPRFRAAYDFMLLRKDESEDLKLLCDWWTHIQTLSKSKQREIIFPKKKRKRKRK